MDRAEFDAEWKHLRLVGTLRMAAGTLATSVLVNGAALAGAQALARKARPEHWDPNSLRQLADLEEFDKTWWVGLVIALIVTWVATWRAHSDLTYVQQYHGDVGARKFQGSYWQWPEVDMLESFLLPVLIGLGLYALLLLALFQVTTAYFG